MPDPTDPPVLPTRARDGGPFYTETPPELRTTGEYPGALAEPWNAATAFLFVLIVVFWVVRLRGRLLAHPFLAVALPILFVGGVGGTLYHGLRNWRIYFLMDVIPITLLGVAVSLYIWIRLGPRLVHLLAAIAADALTQLLGFAIMPSTHLAINLSYASLALLILLPVVAAIIRTRGRQAGWVVTALIAFGMAWFCRLADPWQPPLLPMGTHWLWHTFGAVTTLALSEYVYRLEGVSLRAKEQATGERGALAP